MNVNINFLGHSVEIDPQDIIDNAGLTAESSKREIRAAIVEAIETTLSEEPFPEYDADSEDVFDEIKTLLEASEDEETP